MRLSKPRKSLQEGISPWQAKEDDDDNQMNQFCHKFLPKIKTQKPICEKVNEQYNHILPESSQFIKEKRPISNIYSTREVVQRRNIFDRLTTNSQREPIKSAQKVQAGQLKFEMCPLQQITVKNYIIEGSKQHCNKQTLNISKKKQSSYIMKQKFAQIRRSMNLQLGIWGSVGKQGKEIKYQNKDKQNVILKHIRYEFN